MWAQGLIRIKLNRSHDFALQYPGAIRDDHRGEMGR
jgi:hypothetical protein